MEAIIGIILTVLNICFTTAFILWVTFLSFRIDRNTRAINNLISEQILMKKKEESKHEENKRPVSSFFPTKLDIENYFK